MKVPKYKCICDTNIWVYVCLGEVHEQYVSKFSNIGVADVVKNEIIKWEKDEGKFQKIYTYFCEYEEKDILVIDRNAFDHRIKKIIEHELSFWGFDDLDNSKETIKNLGEFTSLLYAYHLDVPYIHTHDIQFCDTIKMDDLYEQYKNVKLITWNEISEEITDSHSEKLALTKKVESESKQMKNQNQKQKQNKIMEKKLEELMGKFSKSRF